ncbi:MAG: 2-hydroxyacid dehydrogenase [Verrucomicrobia bacterium]|nr:2-hydroxyacid dehydrogenase [Verrucomicrobiota bacterium]
MNLRILVAGDHFILPRIFADAIRTEVKTVLEFREYQSPWPGVPFGRIGEVTEASGSEDEVIQALDGVSIYVANHAPLTKKVLEGAPDLKLAVIARGGPTNANVEAATRHGVLVCNAPGRNATATAEHAMSLILAVLRRIPESHAALAQGEWRGDYYEYDKCGLELENSTAGLIGYGAIGSRVARMLRGFGCQILVYDPYVKAETVGDLAQVVELNELLSRSRIVSLHARATPETRGMIGTKQVAAMPAGSVVINCARGTLVDYDAICDALDSGHLWGAGFDVFPEEPIPANSRLLKTPHLVMTPHIAGASRQTAEKAARIAAGEVRRFLDHEPLEHCVNPEAAIVKR